MKKLPSVVFITFYFISNYKYTVCILLLQFDNTYNKPIFVEAYL